MKTAVTVCVVPEMAAGPFVFHGDPAGACRTAAELGYDAVEVFAGSAAELRSLGLPALLAETGLTLAAVGTGAGLVKHGLTLSSPDAAVRTRAAAYVRDFIDAAGEFGSAVIVGSMQGRAGPDRAAAYHALRHAVSALAEHAGDRGVTLLIEPLNRYESDLLNTLADVTALAADAGAANVRVLADLFHMNIEEASMAGAVRAAGPVIGHVHLADSNRRAAGLGHTDLAAAVAALRDIGYAGCLSAEVFSAPGEDARPTAARHIQAVRRLTTGAAT